MVDLPLKNLGNLMKPATSVIDGSLVYTHGRINHTIEFVPGVLNTFQKFKQKRFWQKEAGGQLFAKFINETVQIVKATGPKKTDRRSRFYFYPDRLREQNEINTIYKQGLHYIGDWHTHAEDKPTPSKRDVKSINECVRESKHDLNGFLLVIVGRLDFPQGLFVGFSDGVEIFPIDYQPSIN